MKEMRMTCQKRKKISIIVQRMERIRPTRAYERSSDEKKPEMEPEPELPESSLKPGLNASKAIAPAAKNTIMNGNNAILPKNQYEMVAWPGFASEALISVPSEFRGGGMV